MATKKTISSKNKSTSFKKFSNFNLLHAITLIGIFSIIGSVVIYQSQAARLNWVQLAQENHCKLDGFGVPPTLKEGSNGKCTKMLKYIIKHRATPAIKSHVPQVDEIFGTGLATAVKMIKNDYHLKNPFGIAYVDPPTWVVIKYIWGHGYYPKAYQPPPPPNTGLGFGQKPPPSGILKGGDADNFGTLYDKYNSTGWCIVNHESRNAGMYTAIQNNGKGPATGAFQFEGGYGTIPNSHTWDKGVMPHFAYWPRAYQYAALAPADVQWTAFFWLYQLNPGAWHGTNCPGT
ncbi:MAG TPA: hypothetical protein VLF39_03700 [Candidatus Saccharimonadales bacterium]|nr:hypothetical protein [Candidatus Saccharimonadales bacterium]